MGPPARTKAELQQVRAKLDQLDRSKLNDDGLRILNTSQKSHDIFIATCADGNLDAKATTFLTTLEGALQTLKTDKRKHKTKGMLKKLRLK
jgi:hypothetical protein